MYINKVRIIYNTEIDVGDIVSSLKNINHILKYNVLKDKHFNVITITLVFKSEDLSFLKLFKDKPKLALIQVRSIDICKTELNINDFYNGKNIYNDKKYKGCIHKVVLAEEYENIVNI